MKKMFAVLSVGLVALSAAPAVAEEQFQDYIIVRAGDGTSVMEKAWVVSPRIIVTTPFEMDAYMSDSNGILSSSKAGVNFLARNRMAWMKVYTSDVDLPVSVDIPGEVLEVMAGLSQAIERAGGLDNFRKNVRPRQQNNRQPVISVRSSLIRIS